MGPAFAPSLVAREHNGRGLEGVRSVFGRACGQYPAEQSLLYAESEERL